ncbi:MAG: hypothetical protein KIT31_03995 [Deltaproteobacteria bacterium]|nr:hypothetical protein [Deltaproteobacteria bacterium]
MNREELKTLLRSKDLTFAQLRERVPEIAASVSKAVAVAEQARLTAVLADSAQPIRAHVARLDASWTPGTAVAHVTAALRAAAIDDRELTAAIGRLRDAGVEQPIVTDQPIATHPEITALLDRARVLDLVDVAALSSKAAQVVAELPTPESIDDATLVKLMVERQLTEAEARIVGFSASLLALSDGDADLATAIRNAPLPLTGRPATSTRDLAALSPADWDALTAPHLATRTGERELRVDPRALATRLATLHPAAAFGGRLPRAEAATIVRRLELLASLAANNPVVVGVPFERLDLRNVASSLRADARASHTELRRLARAYPAMRLAELLDDTPLDNTAKATAVVRRTTLIQKALELLGDTFALQLDLNANSLDLRRLRLDELDASVEERAMVVGMLQAHQRIWTLTHDIDDARALVMNGLTSAHAIASSSFAAFRDTAELAESRARLVWERAHAALADVTLTAGALLDGLIDVGGQTIVPPASDVAEQLKSIAGAQQLFGSLSFCACEHCQSILGPAAYFVDLMKFVDENLRPTFASRPDHPLDLKTRRPDLWTLELTCANTNDLVPTLDIIAEILETDLARRAGFSGAPLDRAAIQTFVYRDTLAARTDSVRQPFHLALTRITAYLDVLGQGLAAIAETLGASTDVRARCGLRISRLEWDLLTTAELDLATLSRLYGIDFAGTAAAVDEVDSSVLARALARDRAALGELVATRYVAAGGARLELAATKRTPASVQNDVELVGGLTADALDRLHRISRLQTKLPWSIAELDRVIAALGASDLDPAVVSHIALAHEAQRFLGTSADELAALIGESSILDRVFNPPGFAAADGSFPQPARRFIHPAFRATAAPADAALPRLLLALGVDLGGLAELARRLAPVLAQETRAGFDPDAPDEGDRYFVLSAGNLATLYRHARLAKLLRIDLGELFQVLGIVGRSHLARLEDLLDVLELERWRATVPYRLDDLSFVLGQPPRDEIRFPNAAELAARVVAATRTSLSFKDALFAVTLGTTEQASRELLAANSAVVESTTDALGATIYRLAPGVDLATAVLQVPATATITSDGVTRAITGEEIRTVLAPYRTSDALIRTLAGMLGHPASKIAALLAVAGRDASGDSIARALRGDGAMTALEELIEALRIPNVVFGARSWSAASIEYVRSRATQLTGAPLPDATGTGTPFLTLTQLRALSTFARVRERGASSTPADLHAILDAFDPTVPDFAPAVDALLARELVVPGGTIAGLRGVLAGVSAALPAIERIERAAALAAAIGIDVRVLGALISEDFATMSLAANALAASIASRHRDPGERAKALELAEHPVRERRRDALVEALLRSVTPRVFEDPDQLFGHFLIDVAAGGCATTSRVVAATASVQLYVHRALMNLERDDLAATDPAHVALRLPAEAASEWTWRKTYRVWEANRKVFLWPENYIEPDLRDDKTPLFRQLEEELLQTDISDQAVLDSYAKYLKGLEEVSALVIAGAYHEVRRTGDRPGDTLHLFGVTAEDPPVYYYRTCENLIAGGRAESAAPLWSPWQPVPIQISSRRVGPVIYRGRLHLFWTELKTRSFNVISNGGSSFAGYRHRMTMKLTTLRPDGTWNAPQEVLLPEDRIYPAAQAFGPGRGVITDQLSSAGIPRFDDRVHREALDDYTLAGPSWEGVWLEPRPDRLAIHYRNFHMPGGVDLFARTLDQRFWDYTAVRPQLLAAKGTQLFCGTPGTWFWNAPAFANCAIENERMDLCEREISLGRMRLGLHAQAIAELPAVRSMIALPGSIEDALLQSGRDIVLLQGSVTEDTGYVLQRIGTTLADPIGRRLFEEGLDALLAQETQLALAEADLPIKLIGGRIEDRSNRGTLDFRGAYGTYYRELFFHIPFLIANALHAKGRYAAAQRWYHYIFDPTAEETFRTGLEVRTLAATGGYQVASAPVSTPQGSSADLAHLVAPSGDIVIIGRSVLEKEALEIRILDAASGYRRSRQYVTTALREVAGPLGFALGPNGDIFAFHKRGTASRTTEIHVLAAVSEYRRAALKTRTTIEETDDTWAFLVAGNRDVFAIQRNRTDSRTTEIRVLSAASMYQQVTLRTGTGLRETDASFDFALAPNRDLVVIEKQRTRSGTTEVRVLSAARGYRAFELQTGTTLGETDGRFSFGLDAAGDLVVVGHSPSPDDRARSLLDRVWRYREFRGLDRERLRDLLTDEVAIALYRRDPFNPHAIARRRISAYQKCIVMKYVENLLDWGDLLFTQFTTETVNEAMMLYMMASDVLGPRPVQLGDCGEGVSPKTYERIAPLVDAHGEILPGLETWIAGHRQRARRPRADRATAVFTTDRAAMIHATMHTAITTATATQPDLEGRGFRGASWKQVRTASWGPAQSGSVVETVDRLGGRTFEHAPSQGFERADRLAWSLIRQLSPAFCVPPNKHLLSYWDRVADRQFKLRHCLDITGVKRELALFAPELDAATLARIKAAGLTLEDVLTPSSGELPPYRFLFLIERAKSFAASLAGFGSSLLATLEKQDVEDLNRARLDQALALAQLTTRQRRLEIALAEEGLAIAQRQREAAQYRRDFYAGLSAEDRNRWEVTESAARHASSGLRTASATLEFLAGVLHLIPQVGSPFAMKYGGLEQGNSTARVAVATRTLAAVADAVAASTGLEGNLARRSEGWEHQRALSDHELRALERQVVAAEIRQELATHALALHETGIDQLQEMIELNATRFTQLGLYTFLSSELQRLHRGAYVNALAAARLAEQAYRFERGYEAAPALSDTYWDTARSGLLAGDRLLLDLQTLERRYLETDYRNLEIDQPFALSQISPAALLTLRETGSCDLDIPEVCFDLFYPGHYRRRIKGVRLTIPCITGPYVNVGATLTLLDSWIRPTAREGAELLQVPASRSVAIATSTAQNDGGVFELSFRDERYMPFEGLGAISRWRISLPSAFRQFDYQTINDVIISISYCAEQDGALRERVEAGNAALLGSVLNYFAAHDTTRVFSLRQELSAAFTRLLRSPAGTPIKIQLTERHFPAVFRKRTLQFQRGQLLVRTADGAAPVGLRVGIAGETLDAFSPEPRVGGIPAAPLPAVMLGAVFGEHTLVIEAAGDLAPVAAPGDLSALDADKVTDVLLKLDYRIA